MLFIDLCTYCYSPCHPRLSGSVAYFLSLSEPEGLISEQLLPEVPARPAINFPADARTQHLVLWVFFIYLQKFSLGLHQLSASNTAGVSTALAQTVTCHFLTKNVYYNSPTLTEHQILYTHYSSCEKRVLPARIAFSKSFKPNTSVCIVMIPLAEMKI